MADRKYHIMCLTLFSMLMLMHGAPTSPNGPSTLTHRPPTSPTAGKQEEGRGAEAGDTDAMTETQVRLDSTPQAHKDQQEDISTEDDQLVTEILLKYGYFRQGEPLHLQTESAEAGGHSRAERDLTNQDSARAQALRRFQSFFGLPPTGVADRETIRLMKAGRCGVADIPEEEVQRKPHHVLGDSQSPSDYSLLGSKWGSNSLTWRLDGPSNQLSPGQQRRTIQDAFATWAQVVPLTFRQKRGRGSVDISIQFGRRHHGDDYPFDGKGKVLAHAFGPGEVSISGDMHLDNDEQWTVQGNPGSSNLFLVAAHELGHSLGLAHSRDPDALMYPYYGLTDSLGQDDIQAIQSLYGKRIGQPPVTPRPRPTPTTTTTTPRPAARGKQVKSATYYVGDPQPRPRPGCDVHFDAVFQDTAAHTDVYSAIRGDSVYRFNRRGLLNGYPSTLNSVYPGAPAKADAVFGLPDKSATYFIKDNRVWRYTESRLDPAYPKDLNPSHFRETIRYVLPVVDATGVHRIFVFGRTLWLEYNFDTIPHYTPHAHVIPQYWPDVAADVIYAVRGHDANFYFVSPDSHVVLNSFRRAVHGGKREGHPHWLQSACDVSSGSTVLHSFGSTVLVALFVMVTFCTGNADVARW